MCKLFVNHINILERGTFICGACIEDIMLIRTDVAAVKYR
jgi:hypothetical protein